MINIKYNNQIKEISENLLKLSVNLKWLSEGKETEEEPIPLMDCDDEIFEIFNIWFNELNKIGIVKIPENINKVFTFKFKMFENYDTETLYKLLKFSFSNQINLLLNTIGYVIALKQKIKQYNDKYYLIIDKQFVVNECLTKQYKTIEIPFVYMNFIKNFHVCSYKKYTDYLTNNQKHQIKQTIKNKEPSIINVCPKPRHTKTNSQQQPTNNIGNYTYEYNPELLHLLQIPNLEINDIQFVNRLDCNISNSYFLVVANEINDLEYFNEESEYSEYREYLIDFENFVNVYHYTINQKIEYNKILLEFIIKHFDTENLDLLNRELNFNVEKIAMDGFKNMDFETFTIPNCITEIGNRAFKNCSNLTSITISDSVKEIGEYAFSVCCNLPSITIPNSVKKLGNYTFSECSNLSSITISNSISSISEGAFLDCKNLRSITIPDSVTKIGIQAFLDCSNLTSIIIPNSIKEIGYSAFSNCRNLTSITIPNTIKEIGDSSFSGCSNLTSITIPNSVTKIGKFAFENCLNLDLTKCFSVQQLEMINPHNTNFELSDSEEDIFEDF